MMFPSGNPAPSAPSAPIAKSTPHQPEHMFSDYWREKALRLAFDNCIYSLMEKGLPDQEMLARLEMIYDVAEYNYRFMTNKPIQFSFETIGEKIAKHRELRTPKVAV